MEYRPEDDGITHVNIYSKAKTDLGRLLSNFTKTPFKHPVCGEFGSMEAFYYYVSTGCKLTYLKPLYGFKAKEEGRKHPRVTVEGFEEVMRLGLYCKLIQNKHIRDLLIASSLPIVHYYDYGGKVVVPKGNDWLIDEITKLREKFKEGYE